MSGRLTLRRCPLTLLDESTDAALRMAKFAKMGLLPDPGSWQDQREVDLYAIELTLAEQNRCRAEMMEMPDE